MRHAGLYIHIPFCVSRCFYCDFASTSSRTDIAHYADALVSEIALRPWQERRITSVYFGGGTPSRLPGDCLRRIMTALRARYDIAEDAEISLEANPNSVTIEKLASYRESGINRLSIGAQATQSQLLQAIGRSHTWENVISAIASARVAGFDNISVDLLYGLPGQSAANYLESISAALSLGVNHLSAYSLILEEGTVLHERRESLAFPSEDTIMEMQEQAIGRLEAEDLLRYEISNYAREGFACRHNILYWENGEYLGLGCAAHGRLGMMRYHNTTDLAAYYEQLRQGKLPTAGEEALTEQDDAFDTMMMGTRMLRGVNIKDFSVRFGKPPREFFSPTYEELIAEGYAREKDGYFSFSPKGLDMQNQLLLRFMP